MARRVIPHYPTGAKVPNRFPTGGFIVAQTMPNLWARECCKSQIGPTCERLTGFVPVEGVIDIAPWGKLYVIDNNEEGEDA